jgi:uncharacterized membrane protein YphA (DoxX/SURF4 family)
MDKKRWISTILVISRVILGLVFIFSGFVKGVDPLGSAYKFSDYFAAFGIGSLGFLTLPMAFILSAAEFLIGISLLLNLKFRLGAWAVLIFMSFFAVLTFILALTNPVTDCGCFGDAIIMTNWETFFKNMILMPFVIAVFLFRKQQPESFPVIFSWLGILVFAFCFLWMEWHVYRHLPWMDFRPYSVGTSIPEKMVIPEGAPQDVYQTFLYYEKDGEVTEFNEENFPWQDTTWKFVDSRHVLISKGYEPPIHDFTIVDAYDTDISSDILSDPGFSFLLISDHLEKADEQALGYAEELSAFCDATGHAFYCLTASGSAAVQEVQQRLGLGFGIYTTDEITLKTIIRANPGLLLLKEGTILAKWHYHDFPPIEEITTRTMPEILTEKRQVRERRMGILAVLVLVAVSLSIYLAFPRTIRS